ncbi:MAG: O-antigen ligase family protein [bacterium]|nr:O-antigen ligase family protein [bacterium]
MFTLPWVGADLIILLTGRDAGAGLQPSWLLAAGAWLAAGRPRHRWRVPTVWRRVALLAGAAVLVSGAGLVVAPAPVGWDLALVRFLKQILQLAVMAMFMAWPVVHLVGSREWKRTAQWLVAGALLQAAYGALQQVSGAEPLPLLAALDAVFTSNPSILSGSTMLYVGDRFVDVPRLRGTACEPLYLGNYLLLVLPMLVLTGWRRRWRLSAAAVLGLLLLLTWSRGAWLGAGAAWVVAAWWGPRGAASAPATPRHRWRRWVAGLAGASGLILLAMAAGWEEAGLPLRRLAQSFSHHDWSNLTRLYSVQAAWRAWLLSPVVGIGWGQFGWHFPALVDPTGLQAMFTWPVVGNLPLLILCETGLAGAAALIWAAAGLARGVVRARRELRSAEGQRVGACAIAATGIAVQYLSFSQYNLAHAWVALGLLATALLEARRTGKPA